MKQQINGEWDHSDDCLHTSPLPTGDGYWHCTCGYATYMDCRTDFADLQAENAQLIDSAHLEVRTTYDSAVAQAWREKLAEVQAENALITQRVEELTKSIMDRPALAQLAKEHQTAVDLFDVIAEIAELVGIDRSEPEFCRKAVTAVRGMVELNKEAASALEPFASVARAWDRSSGTKTMSDYAIMRSGPYQSAAQLLAKLEGQKRCQS